MSSQRDDDDRYSGGYSQDGPDMAGGMEEIPSRRPPKTSPNKHRHHKTRGSEAHHEVDDHDSEDDGKSNVSAASKVSEKTANTRGIISGTSLSPTSGPYRSYADLPLRSTPTQAQTPSRSPARPSSRGYGQSPPSPGQFSSADMTRSDSQGLRFPKVPMPFLEDYIVPSAKNQPQYKESPRDQRPALPSGYARPSNPNTADDYKEARVGSPSTRERGGEARRAPRGSYPDKGGDDYRRDSRGSATSAYPSNARPYQSTSPRDDASSPISPGSTYDRRSREQKPDPYLAQVANATEEKASRRDSGITKPIDVVPRSARPSRLSVSSQGYANSPNTPSSVKSPLGQMPVRTYGDGLEDSRGYNLSPSSAYPQDDYFAPRGPGSQGSRFTSPRPRPKAEYKGPFDEPFIPPLDGPIKERERAPRMPASPSSYENSRTDIRPDQTRKPSGPSSSLLSPHSGSCAGTPRPGSSTSTRADEVDERLESLRKEREATRKAREKILQDWNTRMTNKMPGERQAMQKVLRTEFKNSADLQHCLENFGWKLETAVGRNEEAIANLSLDFTDAYNNHVAEIYKKYLDLDLQGLPSEDVDLETSTKTREGKPNWDGVQEDSGCRVTTEFTLKIAGGKHTEPVTRQRRQEYGDLRTTVPPPQVFVPDIGVQKSRRSESRDYYDEGSDRRQKVLTYDSKYDGRGRRDEIAYDSKHADEGVERSLVSLGGRERSGYDNVPRQGELLLVPEESRRRGNSTTTTYRYDTSRAPSDAGTREASKEPSRRGSRVPSRVPSRAPSRGPSRAHSRAPSRHGSRRGEGGGESGRKHRSKKHRPRTERTESEERRRDRRREERRLGH